MKKKALQMQKIFLPLAMICLLAQGCGKNDDSNYVPDENIFNKMYEAGLQKLNPKEVPSKNFLSARSNQDALFLLNDFSADIEKLDQTKSGETELIRKIGKGPRMARTGFLGMYGDSQKPLLKTRSENPGGDTEVPGESVSFPFKHEAGLFSTHNLTITCVPTRVGENEKWNITEYSYWVSGLALGWTIEREEFQTFESELWNVCRFSVTYHMMWGLSFGGIPLGYRNKNTFSYSLKIERINGTEVKGTLTWTESNSKDDNYDN